MGASGSRANALAEFDRAHPAFKHFIEVGPGFWNYNTSFYVRKIVNIHTQMSVARLANGKFVSIDAAVLSTEAKAEFDELTANGDKLEACIHTHPFHTLAIAAFHTAYPSTETRRYIGCPRHLAKITEDTTGAKINWSGDFQNPDVIDSFTPDLEMRIPDGCEFVDPQPQKTNHLSNVFVFHPASKTVLCDDTVMYFRETGALLRLIGVKPYSMRFHRSLEGVGLYRTKEAPLQFGAWFRKMLNDWDFEHLVSAHTGPCYSVAKTSLEELLTKTEPLLQTLSERNAEEAKNGCASQADPEKQEMSDPDKCECG